MGGSISVKFRGHPKMTPLFWIHNSDWYEKEHPRYWATWEKHKTRHREIVTGYNRRIRDPGRQEEDRRAIYILCPASTIQHAAQKYSSPAWLSKCHKNTGTVTLEVSAWRWQVTTESSAPLCDWQLKSNALGRTPRQSSVRQKVWSVSSHCLDLRLRRIPWLKFERQLVEASAINLRSAFETLISVECFGK